MMWGRLNKHIVFSFQVEFKDRCHNLLIEAYAKSVSKNIIKPNFEENSITAILHNYIDINPKKVEWGIITNTESQIYDPTKDAASKFSRIDLRFALNWQEKKEFKYFMEAKNLKSSNSALKRRYINSGIDSFLTDGKYNNCDGFLVGYVLEGNANDCIVGLNKLLKKDARESEQMIVQPTLLSVDNCISSHKDRNILHLFLNYSVQ